MVIYPAVVKAARYIVSQEDARGLVWCTSTGEEVHGIFGWRNIIPHYRISGAVTEVNAECAAALRAAGHLAENRGHQEEACEFGAAAARLTEATGRRRLAGSDVLVRLRGGTLLSWCDGTGAAKQLRLLGVRYK